MILSRTCLVAASSLADPTGSFAASGLPLGVDLAFKRLGAILEQQGLGFEDLVELVSYHVRIDDQLTTFREVKERYIRRDFPAWTILGVASLARPNLLIEIKAVAAKRA